MYSVSHCALSLCAAVDAAYRFKTTYYMGLWYELCRAVIFRGGNRTGILFGDY